MSLNILQTPREVIALMNSLFHDHRDHPHRFTTHYSPNDLMARAHRHDRQGRMTIDYEMLAQAIERWGRRHMQPGKICDNCRVPFCDGAPAADYDGFQYLHTFDSYFNSYFLCDECAEDWLSGGDANIQGITVPLFQGLYISPERGMIVEFREHVTVMEHFPLVFDVLCAFEAEAARRAELTALQAELARRREAQAAAVIQ